MTCVCDEGCGGVYEGDKGVAVEGMGREGCGCGGHGERRVWLWWLWGEKNVAVVGMGREGCGCGGYGVEKSVAVVGMEREGCGCGGYIEGSV